jgi:hypothetical protein
MFCLGLCLITIMATINLSPTTIQNTIERYFAASPQDNHKSESIVACFAEDSISYDPALEGRDRLLKILIIH